MSDLFASYGASVAREPLRKPRIDPKSGGVLVATGFEAKMQEKQRLSRAYRRWRRSETKSVLASEPRLGGFLRYLRTVTAETGDELVEAIRSCDWLLDAPHAVRIFALRMIQNRCDHINRKLGFGAMDDPLPPDTSVFLRSRAALAERGRL